MPAISVDGDSLEQVVGLRQPEIPAQEGLGVAPAKQIIVPPEQLMQKASEAAEDAACDRKLLGFV